MAYAGWGSALVGMALGLVLTIGISWVTTPAAGEQRAIYFDLAD